VHKISIAAGKQGHCTLLKREEEKFMGTIQALIK
jgi:hypothetical protein